MRYAFILFLFIPSFVWAQRWQCVGNDAYTGVTNRRDGCLALLRCPSDILLSTDSGLTWHEVYHSRETIDTIYQESDGSVVAVLDSVTELVSNDTGRTWQTESGEWKVERVKLSLPASLMNNSGLRAQYRWTIMSLYSGSNL